LADGHQAIEEPWARPSARTDPGVGGTRSDVPALVTDFDGCVFRLANLRMVSLQRVAFIGCTIEDVDAYGADLEDVSFHDSTLSAFSIDQATATRVDLRRCTPLGLTAIARLDGFLISEAQLLALAPQLAAAAGLTIEADA